MDKNGAAAMVSILQRISDRSGPADLANDARAGNSEIKKYLEAMLKLGLVRAATAEDGVSYEITDAGLRFLRESEDIDRIPGKLIQRQEVDSRRPINSKQVGLIILAICPVSMVLYDYGILFVYTHPMLELTVAAAVSMVLGILTWIGYTMVTEPPSPEPRDPSELDDLRSETINPHEDRRVAQSPMFSKIVEAEIGEGTVVRDHVNLYRCKIGRDCKIDSFVYIEEGVTVGNDCKIKPHVYIPTGVIIEDRVFLGPNVTFTNGDRNLLKTVVGQGASIGAQSVILPGVRIGRNATVGAGSIVTSDIPDDTPDDTSLLESSRSLAK